MIVFVGNVNTNLCLKAQVPKLKDTSGNVHFVYLQHWIRKWNFYSVSTKQHQSTSSQKKPSMWSEHSVKRRQEFTQQLLCSDWMECEKLFPSSMNQYEWWKGETNRQFDLKASNRMFTMRLKSFTMLSDAVISIEIISHV